MENGEKIGYREPVYTSNPEITRVFDFPILEGDIDCLKDPDKLILPESIARKIFGDQPAVGKMLHAEENVETKDNR